MRFIISTERSTRFIIEASSAFQRVADAAVPMSEAIAAMGPALARFEWSTMTPAQRRRWCQRLVRGHKKP